MPDLKPSFALGGDAPAQAVFGALTLRENSALGLASLALRRGAATPTPFALTLPGPGGWTGNSEIAAFWTGPGQWMIEREDGAETDFIAMVQAAAPGCSVTDQTDGWVALDIASTDGDAPILRLLERLVNLDPTMLTPGYATRSTLHHMGVFVLRRDTCHVRIMGMRGFAGSLWHAIAMAASRLA